MKGGLERGALAAGLLVLVASVQFVACLLGPFGALPVAAALGVVGALLWIRANLPHRLMWLPVLLLTLASLVPVAVSEWALRPSIATWFAPLLVALGSGITFPVTLQSRIRCSLCNRRFGRGDVAFRCPRCTQTVCDETCWDFEHRRCRLCLEQRVPLLPAQDGWWTRVAGPRAGQGRCSRCLATAQAADLRLCPHCRRPQCRDCWDFANGECSRCGHALPELPASLTMAVVQVSARSMHATE